jgi:hypothetical protein
LYTQQGNILQGRRYVWNASEELSSWSSTNGFALNSVHATVPLLHIDDSAADRLLVKEAIALTKSPFALYQCDGLDSAVAYFTACNAAQAELHPRPALVLLDYDLGGYQTGCEFLHWLRVAQRNTTTSVVMFSGTSGRLHVA